MTETPVLPLSGFTFSELFTSEGLHRLDALFLKELLKNQPAVHEDLLAYRHEMKSFTPIALSELLITASQELESFLIDFFDIEKEAQKLATQTVSYNPISTFKKFFILRKAKKQLSNKETLPSFKILNEWLEQALQSAPLKSTDKELAVSLLATHYLSDTDRFTSEIEQLTHWCVQALATQEGQKAVAHWVSFRLPNRTDYENLVPTVKEPNDPLQRHACDKKTWRARDGFKLTDPRMNAKEVQDEVNYCIYCHDHEGDFCSKGFPVKKGDPLQGFKKNPLDVTLTGCPLEERISEMNLLKRDGFALASLAMVMVDNPMCPATGHRICNDCMKACIYQKQDPVNIPQIETRVLTDVLDLPWGVEIYDLLTRWNPLRQKQWVMKPYNGLKVMIAGMGPAGFTLAHHLLLEGFAVVGFDGLKIEPLPEVLIKNPIHRYEDLKESLDARLMAGFGGVAEYGITVRWDKNFLKLIYLSLMRKPYFQVFGSTRFGGTLKIEDAWKMGFDHFAIAVGAGLPKALNIPGSLATGMRQANDFLMALQLGNAAKKESLTNLQIRLPAVVIGGGLTGVDTATEVQAYYITQVEKIADRYHQLCDQLGEESVLKELDVSSQAILEEYLLHAKAVKEERERAAKENEPVNFISLLQSWGGVTIVYRRSMQESPAYLNNHEELKKAFEEGIYYLEALEPSKVELDPHGHVSALICHQRERDELNLWKATDKPIRIPAHSIFVATGTQPNIAYEFEHRGTFNRRGYHYLCYESNGDLIETEGGIFHCKDPLFGPFTSYQKDDFRVSLVGDTHPVFHGNVVKAIASGLRTYPKILHVLENKLGNIGSIDEYREFAKKMKHLFTSVVTQVERRTENVIELTIQSPLAAMHFQPGQFYRLQNYETYSKKINNTLLQIEPLALTATEANKELGTLKFMVIEKGASSKLCSTLKPNDPVSLMGPTGVRAKLDDVQTILIIGNQLSIALLQSYGHALRHEGHRVIYYAHFNTKEELYAQEKLEHAADVILWSTQSGEPILKKRPQDYVVQGDIVERLIQYANGKLDPQKNTPEIPLSEIDRIYLIGGSSFLKNFQKARQTTLKPYLTKSPKVLGSVYSTMQCMLKGVCAQCLQWQIDPETGKRTKAVFACSWPDQPLEIIDFDNIDERLIQNRLQEKLSELWVDHLLRSTTHTAS